MAEIALAQAIKDLRRELTSALEEGKGQSLRFKPGPVELDLEVAMTLEGGGKGEVKFWVVAIGADGKASRVGTHKIKLSLQPVDKEGREFLIRDEAIERPK
jgi:Trypsin-co-occurring domain 2